MAWIVGLVRAAMAAAAADACDLLGVACTAGGPWAAMDGTGPGQEAAAAEPLPARFAFARHAMGGLMVVVVALQDENGCVSQLMWSTPHDPRRWWMYSCCAYSVSDLSKERSNIFPFLGFLFCFSSHLIFTSFPFLSRISVT